MNYRDPNAVRRRFKLLKQTCNLQDKNNKELEKIQEKIDSLRYTKEIRIELEKLFKELNKIREMNRINKTRKNILHYILLKNSYLTG